MKKGKKNKIKYKMEDVMHGTSVAHVAPPKIYPTRTPNFLRFEKF